jgi:protein SCO1/2
MNNRSSIRLFVLLVFVLPVTAYAIFDLYESRTKLPVIGKTTEINGQMAEHHIQNFNLFNQDGKTISLNDWKGKIVVANFFFTHCPVVCPKMTAGLKKVNTRYYNDDEILINSFTVDPERDDPVQMKKYAERFKISPAKWNLLTGDKKEIYKLARNSFMIVATDGDGGPDDFIHSEKLVLIDRTGRIRGYYTGTDDKEVNKLLRDIKRLKYEN